MGGRVREQVGRVLRELREAAGLTLEDVERRTAALGQRIPRSTVNDIESGRSSLPVEALAVLGSVLGTGTLDLLSEVVAQLGRERLPRGTPEELAERGRQLAKEGVDLEAAWHFDGAAATATDPVFRAKMLVNASHSYFMAGAYALSLHRVEDVLDAEDVPVEQRLSAVSRHGYLLAAMGRNGRARDDLELVKLLRKRCPAGRAVAYSLVTECWTLLVLGDGGRRARTTGRQAATMFKEQGFSADAARALAGVALASLVDSRSSRADVFAREALELASGTGDRGAEAVSALTVARMVVDRDPAQVAVLLGFATGPRPRLAHRTECLVAWKLLERASVLEGDYRQAERWRRRAGGAQDPVTRRIAACYLRGLDGGGAPKEGR